MKRIIVLCILASLLLSACISAQPQETSREHLPENLRETSVSKWDQRLLDISNAALLEEFGITDLSMYRININEHNAADKTITYTLYLYGYRTTETYVVHLDTDNTVTKIDENYGQCSVFLDNVTLQMVIDAENKLNKQLKKLDSETDTYLIFITVDSEGWLCFETEVIVHKEDGNFDHEHKIVTERICAPIE